MPRLLRVSPLTREAFLPYGDVLDAEGECDDRANGGAVEIFRDRARIDVDAMGGRPAMSVVRTEPRALPLLVDRMERHPLGSQAFSPLAAEAWLIVVAPAGELDPAAVVAFRAHARQGVNYLRGVWHHPLIALGRASEFLVVERAGEGDNFELRTLSEPWLIEAL